MKCLVVEGPNRELVHVPVELSSFQKSQNSWQTFLTTVETISKGKGKELLLFKKEQERISVFS